MNTPQLCPECGCEIPTGSPAGMCPKCMLQAGFESQPPVDARFQATAPSPQANSGFVPPTPAELAKLFPQLEILELLGQGGMGAVYKARQKGLDRLVAVKILPPEIGRDPAFAERFTREARALAKLNHPNIVSVYDFGDVAGQFYFLMEYVDGVNLRQAIRAGQTTPQECLAIVPQICDALQFAHDEGVVHRDIKPENILLDKKGRVKIADFGLAKLLGTDATDHTLTGTNQVMGTMRYMAPEQMFGSKLVDHRADIYSLGVVFYELLTGEVPVGRFAPPSKKVQIDVRLDEVVLRALEREPEQRYQQASEVRDDLKSVMENQPAKSADETESADPEQEAREWANEITIPGIALFASIALSDRLNKWLGISGGYEPLLLWFALLAICHVGVSKLYHYFYFGTSVHQYPYAHFNTANPTRICLWLSIALGLFACVTPCDYTERGLWGMKVTGSDSESNGVWVMGKIEPFSPADEVGIQMHDVILAVNGHTVGDEKILNHIWRNLPVGSKVEIQVRRGYDGKGLKPKSEYPVETLNATRPTDKQISRFYWHWQLIAGVCFVLAGVLKLADRSSLQLAWRGWLFSMLFIALASTIFLVPWGSWQIGRHYYGLNWEEDWIKYSWHWWSAFAAAVTLAVLGIMEIMQSPRRKIERVETEPRLSRLALAGAIWTPAMWLLTVGIIVLVVIYGRFRPDKLDLRLSLDAISVFCFLVSTFLASIGTTLLGAIAIRQISQSRGKIYGMRLAIADALFFPILLLDGLVFASIAGLAQLALFAIEIKAIDNSQAGIGLRVLIASIIPIPFIVWVDYLMVRTVWRRMTGWSPSKTDSESSLVHKDHLLVNTSEPKALPQLLGVAMGLVLGLFCMTIGLLFIPAAFMFAPIGSGPFWGWVGGAFGCIIGGLGSMVGSWNTYRQLRGETDWMQSPTWTSFDFGLMMYGAIGLVLLIVAPFLSMIGAWGTLENEILRNTYHATWLLGGLMVFQAALFMLFRASYLVVGVLSSDKLEQTKSPSKYSAALKTVLWLITLSATLVLVSFNMSNQGTGMAKSGEEEKTVVTIGAGDPWFTYESSRRPHPVKNSETPSTGNVTFGMRSSSSVNALSWSMFAFAVALVVGGIAWRMEQEDAGKVPFDAQWWRTCWGGNGYFLAFYFLVVLLAYSWKTSHQPSPTAIERKPSAVESNR